MTMTTDDVLNEFRGAGALREGHFVLSSGLHSPVFLQKNLVFMHADRCERLCRALADLIRARAGSVDYVISPAVGGIIPGYETARQLGAGRPTPFAVLSRRQTNGRGRFGRTWQSDSTDNLYASFAFRPRVRPDRMQTFTLWMGVNVCELLANFTGLSPGIKWPNDILFNGRKAGGMLTEARVDADQIRDLVFGLGLNVNQPAGTWPGDLARRAVSLAEVTGAPLDLNRLAAALIGRVLLAYQKFSEGEHLATFADLWHRYDLLRNKPIALLEGGRRHHGIVTGLDDEGALLLRDDHGQAQRFRAGEVTLEKSS